MDASVRTHPRGRSGGVTITISPDYLSALGVCSAANAPAVAEAYCAWISLLDDTPLGRGTKPWSTYRRFISKLTDSETYDIICAFSDASDAILTSCTAEQPTGVFCDFMLQTPVVMEYVAWYKTADPQLLTYILTFLRFLKKMEYEDAELNETAFRGWLMTEEKLSKLSYDKSLLRDLYVIVRYLLPDPDWEKCLPRFGNGAVAERETRGRVRKASSLRINRPLAWFFRRSPLQRGRWVSESLGLAHQADLPQLHSYTTPASRLMFVPKNIKTARSICMEPNAYMFAQQGLLNMFVDAFSRGPMSKLTDLRDQTRNQKAACIGSITGQLDTIDLSSASDTVSYELVRNIFPRSWVLPMSLTRTSRVITPDGSVRRIAKFAPMGSAVCFPTQCVVYAAVSLLATYEYYRSFGYYDSLAEFLDEEPLNVPSGAWRVATPTVYGDDIVSDHRVTGRIVELLELLGFIPNRGKCFTGSQKIRESCGKYYYDGHDVTYVSYRVKRAKGAAVAFDSYVGAINVAYSHGYLNLRSQEISALKRVLLDVFGRDMSAFLPFGVAGGIETYKPRSTLLATGHYRNNRKWQRLERAVIGTSAIKSRSTDIRVDAYELMRWFHRPPEGSVTERRHSPFDAVDSRLKLVWSPASD